MGQEENNKVFIRNATNSPIIVYHKDQGLVV